MSDSHSNHETYARVLLLGLGLLLVWVYTYRLGFLAPRWEEPRRCMVAFEMIVRGDYIVPTVYGELYTKKPPLQNWLIALLAGFDARRIDVILPRLLTVISVFATALVLVLLGIRRQQTWPWLGSAIFLTQGIMIQYGRSGAIDPLFVLWTTAAFATFYAGYSQQRPWLTWCAPQLFVALGVLTKGLAPVFVYPSIAAFLAYERFRNRRQTELQLIPILTGFVVCAIVAGVWLVPFTLSGSLDTLQETGAQEVLSRSAIGRTWSDVIRGLLTFPIEVAVNLLPWSLPIVALVHPAARRVVSETFADDDLFRFAFFVFTWICVCLWVMPGSLGRYVMPAYPFFAIGLACVLHRSRRHTIDTSRWVIALWIALGLGFLGFAIRNALTKPDVRVALPVVACVAAVLIAIRAHSHRAPPVASRALLLTGFLYSSAFATIHAPARAAGERDHATHSRQMAEVLRQDAERRGLDPRTVPIGCSEGVSQAICFEFVKTLQRPLTRPTRHRGPSYAIGHVERSILPERREVIAEGYGDELWYRVAPSE
ncbi:MAG: phospholipid carrier-dependent glycosyltransferase [Myxococcota bacterium]